MKIFNTFGQLAAAKVLTGTPVRVLEPALIDGVVEATGEGLSLLSGNVFVPSFGDQESITARKTSLLDDAFTGGISAYINTYKKDNSGNWLASADGRTSAVFYAGQVWWPLVEIPYTPGGYLITSWGLPTGNPDILEVTTSIGTVFQFNRFTGLIDGGNSGGSTISDTPPINPLAGNRWTRCSDMKSFIWYVDNNGSQWVEDNPSMGAVSHNAMPDRNAAGAHDAIYSRVFDTVAAMKAYSGALTGITVKTRGRMSPDDGGGWYWDIVESSSVVVNGYNIVQLDNTELAAVLCVSNEIVCSRWGVEEERFDGTVDSTGAFNAINQYISDNNDFPVHVVVDKDCLINPFLTTDGRSLISLVADGSSITSQGGRIRVMQGIDYTEGRDVGEEFHFSACSIKANNCLAQGFIFDGNGTGTYEGYNPAIVNIRWEGVSALGPGGGGYHVGNRATGCLIVGGGGQAMGWQNQKQAVIANNVFRNSSGAGFARCESSVLIGNTAQSSHDAPFISNGSCYDIIISGNTSLGTNNGSGIDVTGTIGCSVIGNVIRDSAGHGLQISYNVQQDIKSSHITVEGNTFTRNARAASVPFSSEIVVGSPFTDRTENATDVLITGNKFIVDGSVSGFSDRAVSIAKDAKRVTVRGNVISGTPNANNQIFSANSDCEDIFFVDNEWNGSSIQFVNISGFTGSFQFSGNKGIVTKKDGAAFPNIGVYENGRHEITTIRQIGTSAVDAITITWPGGIGCCYIEIEASQSGDRGVAKKRFAFRGNSGATTAVLLDEAVFAPVGSSVPLITHSEPASSGTVIVKVASSGGTAHNTIISCSVICDTDVGVSFN